jgi:hypothetical protein
MSRSATVVVIAGLIGGFGWIAKIVIMALQGGPDLDSIPETIAFLSGLVGVAVTAAALGVYLTRNRPTGVRAAAAVAGIVVFAVAVGGGQSALSSLGDSWVQEEAVFGILGVIAVAVAVAVRRGQPDPA